MLFSSAIHKANTHFYENKWHDYGEYIYPLSIFKLREGYALSKCFSFFLVIVHAKAQDTQIARS